MLKKSLLIGSAVLLASTPLLVAQDRIQHNMYWNTIDCGKWSFDGVSGENYQHLSWTSGNTASASIFATTGGQLTISTSGTSLAQNKAAFPVGDLKQDSNGWTRISSASHIQVDNIKDEWGLKGRNAELIGISGGSGGETLTLKVTGLTEGKSYSIALFFTTTRGSGETYKVTLKSDTQDVDWAKTEHGYMSTAVGRDSWLTTGTLSSGLDFNDQYGFGALAAGVYAEFTYTGGDGTLEIKLEQGINSIAQIQMVNISQMIIPEPSAFGLLAGVGAIALTVSRRRRK